MHLSSSLLQALSLPAPAMLPLHPHPLLPLVPQPPQESRLLPCRLRMQSVLVYKRAWPSSKPCRLPHRGSCRLLGKRPLPLRRPWKLPLQFHCRQLVRHNLELQQQGAEFSRVSSISLIWSSRTHHALSNQAAPQLHARLLALSEQSRVSLQTACHPLVSTPPLLVTCLMRCQVSW